VTEVAKYSAIDEDIFEKIKDPEEGKNVFDDSSDEEGFPGHN